MEPNMSDADEWDRLIVEARPLSPDRRDALKRTAIRRATPASIKRS
jgi:hypothetical protein